MIEDPGLLRRSVLVTLTRPCIARRELEDRVATQCAREPRSSKRTRARQTQGVLHKQRSPQPFSAAHPRLSEGVLDFCRLSRGDCSCHQARLLKAWRYDQCAVGRQCHAGPDLHTKCRTKGSLNPWYPDGDAGLDCGRSRLRCGQTRADVALKITDRWIVRAPEAVTTGTVVRQHNRGARSDHHGRAIDTGAPGGRRYATGIQVSGNARGTAFPERHDQAGRGGPAQTPPPGRYNATTSRKPLQAGCARRPPVRLGGHA